ncbi:MAG: hypothetical protein ACXVCY_08780 [Pseudobdellovibrionaceae bacterium]
MKKGALILPFIMIISAMAHGATTSVPQDQLENYKKAVTISIADKKPQCHYAQSGYLVQPLEGIIISSQSAVINSDGTQPVLIFRHDFKEEKVQQVTKVTSSADYKTVLSVEVSEAKYGEQSVNTGTLLNPKIEKRTTWNNYFRVVCSFE